MVEGLLRDLYDLVAQGYPRTSKTWIRRRSWRPGDPIKEIFGDTVFVSARHRS